MLSYKRKSFTIYKYWLYEYVVSRIFYILNKMLTSFFNKNLVTHFILIIFQIQIKKLIVWIAYHNETVETHEY